MTNSKLFFLATMLLVAITCPQTVLADGCLVAPVGLYMLESAQQALIEYDRASETEHLTIQPHFTGNTSEFAWIVPVPSLPGISLADQQLFWDLDTMTRPQYQSRDGNWGCFQSNRYGYDIGVPANAVEIIDSQLIGYYQTLIISATESAALTDSLVAWGYLEAGNLDDIEAALSTYVDQGWYFVAMQIDSAAMEEDAPYSYGNYWGALDPIEFVFASTEIIYPMKISAYSAADVTTVIVYVAADHRMQFPGAETHYANKMTAGEIAELSGLSSLRDVLKPGVFITKLRRNFTPQEMDSDLIIARAANDDEFVQINYSGLPWTGILLFGPPAAWAAYRRSRPAKR